MFCPRAPEDDTRRSTPQQGQHHETGLDHVIIRSEAHGHRLVEASGGGGGAEGGSRPDSGMSDAKSYASSNSSRGRIVNREGESKVIRRSSTLDPAVLDDYVLRLILNSALLDIPPKHQSTAQPPPPPPLPSNVRPYWQYAQQPEEKAPALPSYVDKKNARSLSSAASSSPARVVSSSMTSPSPFGRRRPSASPNKLEHQYEESMGMMLIDESPYVDRARFERAKILALAQSLEEIETVDERLRRKRGTAPPRRSSQRRAALRVQQATSEESRLFQEHYARYVTRLSYLSQQDYEEDLHDQVVLDPESARQRTRGLSMAVALSQSITEVMADPIVIDLIKEATITRMRGAEYQESMRGE